MNDRLVILGDLLRINSDWGFHQASNISWFEGIFRQSFGCHFRATHTCCDRVGGFPFDAFYKTLYYDRAIEPDAAWAAFFDASLPRQSMALLADWVDDRFALLFEGSPSLIRALSELGVAILNIRVHPYRCGDDLFLTGYSNIPAIAARLKQACLHMSYFEDFSQKIARSYDNPNLSFDNDSLIFLSQTDRDAVLIQNGHFFDLASVTLEVRTLARGRTLYHKPHPHALQGRLIREWLRLFPDSIELGPDLYQLFATTPRLTFVTASSGSAFEAETFGHTAHYLMARHWGPKGGLSETDRVIPQHYWDASFWDFILHGTSFNRMIPDSKPPPDRLRNTINYHWAPLSWRN